MHHIELKWAVSENTGLWRRVVTQTKGMCEDLRREVVDAQQVWKVLQRISEEFGLHQSTVRQIIQQHCYPSQERLANKEKTSE